MQSKPLSLIMTLLTGISVGLYLAAWCSLLQSGYQTIGIWPGTPAGWLGLGSGTAMAFGSRFFSQWLFRQTGIPEAQAQRLALVSDAPWLLAGLGIVFYPAMRHLAAGLSMEILGSIYLPGSRQAIQLPAPAYIFLLWAGPCWVLSLVLKLVLGVRAYLQCRLNGRAGMMVNPRMLLVLGAAFYLLLTLWSATVYPATGDEPHYLLMVQSMAQDQDLDLANNFAQKDFQQYYPAATLDFHGAARADNKMVTKHFPLFSLLIMPFYLLLGRIGAALAMAVCTGLLAAGIFIFAGQCGLSQAESLWAWLLAVVCLPLGVYYDLIYPEMPAALLMLAAVLGMRQGGSRGVLLITLACALLPWFYPKYIPVSAVLFGGLFFMPNIKLRQAAWSLALLLISGLAFVWFYQRFYHYSMANNPYGILSWPWSALGVRNALGLLVDRDFGIFSSSPVFLLGIIGWLALRRTQARAMTWAALVFLAQYLLFVVFDDYTGSSASFSRQMIMGVILLYPAIIRGWQVMWQQGWLGRSVDLLCLALSAGMALLADAWPMLRYRLPKEQLWAKLGFTPSLYPGMITPGTMEFVWALAWVGVMGAIVVWGYRKIKKNV